MVGMDFAEKKSTQGLIFVVNSPENKLTKPIKNFIRSSSNVKKRMLTVYLQL